MKSSALARKTPMKPRIKPQSGILRTANLPAKPDRKLKLRRCKAPGCREMFRPAKPWVTWHSEECGSVIALAKLARMKANKAKIERKKDRAKKEAAKPISTYRKETQVPCNAYILVRDRDLPCISCGTYNAKWNAGHYIAVGAGGASPLRYDELNIFKQCVTCNLHLHGNLIEMRKGIIARYGIERIEYLEGHHPQPHWTVEDLLAIKLHYREKTKKLLGAEA